MSKPGLWEQRLRDFLKGSAFESADASRQVEEKLLPKNEEDALLKTFKGRQKDQLNALILNARLKEQVFVCREYEQWFRVLLDKFWPTETKTRPKLKLVKGGKKARKGGKDLKKGMPGRGATPCRTKKTD